MAESPSPWPGNALGRLRGMRHRWLSRMYRAENAVRDRLVQRLSGRPELGSPARVVFVCRGNVCRSVFAEHLYRKLDPAMDVVSCGVHVSISAPPPEPAIEVARRHGVEISSHRSRSLDRIVDSPGTLYFVLEPWQARDRRLAEARRQGRVHLLGRWASPPRASIPDPYGRDRERFVACFASLKDALDRIRSRLSAGEGGSR